MLPISADMQAPPGFFNGCGKKSVRWWIFCVAWVNVSAAMMGFMGGGIAAALFIYKAK